MQQQNNTKRIFLWSGPRNISTALMYSFAQREDCKVVDEPLYAHYLSKTDAKNYHPGSAEILSSQKQDGNEVIHDLLHFNEKPILFVKHMTHHLIKLDFDFLTQATNVILTREPKEMLTSFIKQIDTPAMSDVGYQAHLDLIHILQKQGREIIVIDSKKVLKNPRKVLDNLCTKLSISFDEKMLHWEKGARKEDGIWAKYWYTNVHNSTGFGKYKIKNEVLPKNLNALYTECERIYNQLIEFAI